MTQQQMKRAPLAWAKAASLAMRIQETIESHVAVKMYEAAAHVHKYTGENPHLKNQLVCGSVRRRRDLVSDIDIVLIPKPLMFPGAVVNAIKALGRVDVLRKGPKMATITLDGVQVDLFASDEKHWGTHILRWTGSADHNIMLCRRARTLGMALKVSEGLYRGEELIASRTEEDIFRELGMGYIAPERREI